MIGPPKKKRTEEISRFEGLDMFFLESLTLHLVLDFFPTKNFSITYLQKT